jgi:hypothetical protein
VLAFILLRLGSSAGLKIGKTALSVKEILPALSSNILDIPLYYPYYQTARKQRRTGLGVDLPSGNPERYPVMEVKMIPAPRERCSPGECLTLVALQPIPERPGYA